MNETQYLQKAVDILIAIMAAVRNIRLYPAGSPLVAGSVAKVHPLLTEILADREKIGFGESEKKLLVSGRNLSEKEAQKPQPHAFLELLIELEIKSLDFKPGVTPEELEALVRLLSRKPSEISEAGGIRAILQETPMPHIGLDEKVYVAVEKGLERLAASAADLSENDIQAYLPGGAEAPVADPERMRQLAANPDWLSQVLGAGIDRLQTADARGASAAADGFARLVEGLNQAVDGKDRQRILDEAAQSMARADAKQIAAVLSHGSRNLVESGLVETLVKNLDGEQFETLAVRARRASGSEQDPEGETDLYRRLLETDRGKETRERVETLFQSEESQRKGQMSRLKIAMDQLLKGRTDVLADPQVVEALPATVEKLAQKGKAQTAETLIHGLLERLLESPERRERTRIIDTVARTGKTALPVIARQITPEAPWYYLRNLILLMGRLGGEEHLDRLKPMMAHDDFRIQREAFNAIFQIGGDRRGDLLLESLAAAKDPTKILVVSMLGKLRHAPALPALVELLSASRAISRVAVRDRLQERICAALAHIGDPRALPALQRVAQAKTEDSSGFAPSVREAAGKALSILDRSRPTRPPAPARDTSNGPSDPPPEAFQPTDQDPVEATVAAHLQAGDTQAAVRTIYEAIVAAAQRKDFSRAEALRERLFEVDAMALTEIVRSGEIIEAEKSEALDPDHLDLWPELYDTLTGEEANALFFAMKEEVFEPNETILEQGKKNDRLFFINEGRVSTFFRQGDRETLLKTVEKGEIVGNRTFFSISVCTISMVAQTRVLASVLDRSVLAPWKETLPALESKLKNYCLRLVKTEDLLKSKGVDRRTQKRVAIHGMARIHLLSASGKPSGKPFRGELADLSVGGLAFFIHSSKEETIRMLLGRRIQITFKIQDKETVHPIEQDATVIGIQYHQQNEYSIHVRFTAGLDTRLIERLDAGHST